MQPLFPAWSDSVFRLLLVVASLGAVFAPTSMILWARTPYVTRENDPVPQPVEFDHRHHVRDDGIDCFYCHRDARTSKFAGVPSTSICMNCHSQVWQESARLAPVRESWFSDQPIRWRRVYQLPEFVYFDHSAHVSHGVGCDECHGRVDLMARVYATSPLTMVWCLECHRDPDPHLRPVDETTNMEWSPGGSRRAIGASIRAALRVDPPVTCSACHR